MRTTVTLDDDVAAAVDRLRRERGLGLSAAVNELVRAGAHSTSTASPFRQTTRPMGTRVDLTNISDILDSLDQD